MQSEIMALSFYTNCNGVIRMLTEISNVVMKFGGAAMASLESIQQVAELVAERRREARRIVIVVSAMGDTTDRLIA
ncbi:MAG: hypothetical protein KDK78_08790, partial [Chlamydiia bacterium]|nr:hypothetical protein [Chlamydiia bacterium]